MMYWAGRPRCGSSAVARMNGPRTSSSSQLGLAIRVEPRNLARSFSRISARAGLRPIRLHDLRHTTAMLLKNLGVPPRDTMEILGHARIAVTMEIYTSADVTSRRDAIGKLSQLLGSTSGWTLLSLLLSISTGEPAAATAAG